MLNLWGCLLNILLPQFILAHYWKANDVNDANKRTFKTKQYKKIIYQQVHEKEALQNITIILIYLVKYSSVCLCVCVCVTNTNIMAKD